ncbi:MAG: metallophosphoesterase [Isosphaeraceae bacterium]
MRILVVSDLHGDLRSVREAIEQFRPDGLLSCGDWGDLEEVDEGDLAGIVADLPVATTFGNHDPVPLLRKLQNRDGRPLLIEQGEVRLFVGLQVGAIGGIWAKSHRLPHYVTDEDVAVLAAKIARQGAIDVLLTHGCPVGLADLTPSGRHGGQRCFLEASRVIAPRLHLCGHLHVAQERTLRDGRIVQNVGATPEGDVVLIETREDGLAAQAARFSRKD